MPPESSCLYVGTLRHRRHAPRTHAFKYPLFMVYLDLGELERVFRGRWLWSARRPALARFAREDHLGEAHVPLDAAVRDLVVSRGGRRPAGPIRLLTHLRYFGYVFNPVSFYYCFDAAGENVDTIVAEVNNTPWGERHCYVLPAEEGMPRRRLKFRTDKAMHVSPFMPMALAYDWRFTQPGARLAVHMALEQEGRRIFDATLRLDRKPQSGSALAGVLARYPLMTAKVIATIHWEALCLWLKRVPVHTHPAKVHS